MDAEFRTALRNLQRAGGTFSQLDLQSCLDLTQLDDLIHHCILAKMHHLGFQVAHETTAPKMPLLGNSLTVTHQDAALLYDTRPKTVIPRRFREHLAFLEMYAKEQAVIQQAVKALEDLPASVVRRIGENWHLVDDTDYRGARHKTVWHPAAAGETLRLERVSIDVYFYSDRWILSFVWQEILEKN